MGVRRAMDVNELGLDGELFVEKRIRSVVFAKLRN